MVAEGMHKIAASFPVCRGSGYTSAFRYTAMTTRLVLALWISVCPLAFAADKADTKKEEPGLIVPDDPAAEIPAGVEFRKDVPFLPT